jgi:hypothetical protein
MIRRLVIPSIVASIVLALLPALPAAADVVFPPGLRVGLAPPPGMTLSQGFPGFEDRDRQAAITVIELPAHLYNEVEKSVFITELNKPDVTVDKRQTFPFNDGVGFLANFHVTIEGKTFHRWVLLAASAVNPVPDLVTLITVQVPEEALGAYTGETIRAALASVTFRPTPLDEQIGLLPFKIGDLAGFRVVRAIQRVGIVLTSGPRNDDDMQPQMVISVAPGGPPQASERARFAQSLLATNPLPDLSPLGTEAMRIGGQPGYETRAEAKTPTGAPLSVVQWVRFGPSGFMRILAVARKEAWNETFPQFRAIRDGIDLR